MKSYTEASFGSTRPSSDTFFGLLDVATNLLLPLPDLLDLIVDFGAVR